MTYQDFFMQFLTEQSLLPAPIVRFLYSHPEIKLDIYCIADMLYNRDDFNPLAYNIPECFMEILDKKPFASDVDLSNWLKNASKILEIIKTKEIFDGVRIPDEQIRWAVVTFIETCPFVSADTKEYYIKKINLRHFDDTNTQYGIVSQKNINNNRFREYMKLQGFKSTTVTLYVYALNQISKEFCNNLWNLEDVESVDKIKDHIKFPNNKTQQYNLYEAALHQYKAFLTNAHNVPQNQLCVTLKTKLRSVGADRQSGSTKRLDANLVAFCFSCDHKELFPNMKQSEAIREAAKLLKIKPQTLQNIRSYFDYYIPDNPRKGWVSPSESLEKIHKDILNKYLTYKDDGYYNIDNEKLAPAYEQARKILKLENK